MRTLIIVTLIGVFGLCYFEMTFADITIDRRNRPRRNRKEPPTPPQLSQSVQPRHMDTVSAVRERKCNGKNI